MAVPEVRGGSTCRLARKSLVCRMQGECEIFRRVLRRHWARVDNSEVRGGQGGGKKTVQGGGYDGATLTCRCGGELHAVYFGDETRRYRCMNCERIYVLWEYRSWRRGGDDMRKVLAGDGAGTVERQKG